MAGLSRLAARAGGRPGRSGLWGLVSLVPVLLSGTLLSSVRFAAVIFPAFLALGMLGRRAAVDRAVVIGFSFAQAVLFLFWSRFFWVG